MLSQTLIKFSPSFLTGIITGSKDTLFHSMKHYKLKAPVLCNLETLLYCLNY